MDAEIKNYEHIFSSPKLSLGYALSEWYLACFGYHQVYCLLLSVLPRWFIWLYFSQSSSSIECRVPSAETWTLARDLVICGSAPPMLILPLRMCHMSNNTFHRSIGSLFLETVLLTLNGNKNNTAVVKSCRQGLSGGLL